ncbi:MAG: CoA-transferase [Cellulomonas sp.]|nr:CoA-transferase [Cellulomonas sp.]
MGEAVDHFAPDGSTVYIGNFGAQLFALGHELIRREVRNLDVVIASGGILLDQLIGAGNLRSAVFGHCWSPVGPSPAHNFRRAAQGGEGSTVFHEMSLGHITAALTGGAWDVPFMTAPGLPGTGFADEDWSKGYLDTASTTFGDATIVRSIRPDVAFVHVDTADFDGNGLIRGPLGEVLVAAQAARYVILVAENVVGDDSVVAAGPTIPGILVDAVVHHPGAVAPDGVIGRYERDVAAYQAYTRAASTPEGFAAWLTELRLAGGLAHA